MKNKTRQLIYTKKGSIDKNILNAINHCTIEDNKIFTGYYSGSGRFTTRHSAAGTIIELLTAQGYKSTLIDNGGANKEYLKVSKVASKFIQAIK